MRTLRSSAYKLHLFTILTLIAWPNPAVSQPQVLGGVAWMGGKLETPYFFSCSDEPETGAGGPHVYAGAGWGSFSATISYLSAGEMSFQETCRIPPSPAEGVHPLREYEDRRSGTVWAWATHIRYTPSSLPLTVYVGGGVETEGNRFRSAGLILRTPGSFSFYAGGEINQFETTYVDVDQTWENQEVVHRVETGRGTEWRDLRVLKVGVEYTSRYIRRQ